ncbi:Putative uncharacterized protein ps121 [Lactobacillus equicursoris DSM 19284 = JCM 14600 = CIP 110162]|uniref:VRR-NUC domain-containing protein n=1 Tax=Lactobacillus equicursoris TaxID=420645 RepID=UPI00028406E8|nr:VRR-NUC domain-containing protein [Lactobacillus equicursoris]CCK86430.1 Putative uncharacterized protein ps121 [Lactobacillus equicursoris DSM 19284 = JCM 14600 = CIP 110162]
MAEEHKIQNQIRLMLSRHGYINFRANVGKIRLPDGRWFDTGLPRGFPDLFGFKPVNGKIYFLEVKSKTGRARKDQIAFHQALTNYHVIHGLVRSPEEALTVVEGELVGYGFKES